MSFDRSNLDRFPKDPGVYIMKDQSGEVIYVGKANNLRNRVKQYFGQTSDTRFFVALLDEYLNDIDLIITANAKEALILENELIKRHQPRFNVNLKDDKNFLHLRIDASTKWPKIDVVRSPRKDGAQYFGPYHSASKIRQTLKLIEQHFGLRNCDDLTFKNRARPCLQYQIKRCPGPCVLPVDHRQYDNHVQDVIRFLQGREDELVRSLKEKMEQASQALEYESAARYRDQLRAIRGSLEDQNMVQIRQLDQDVFGIYREGASLQVSILFVRRGKMVGSRTFDFVEHGIPDSELLSTFVNLYYNSGAAMPDEVLLPVSISNRDVVEAYVSELKGRRVQLKLPKRGANKRLLETANKNAEHAYFQARRDLSARDGGLVRLKEKLKLTNVPHQIECFDISLFQGTEPVASCVAFEGGSPKRSRYRQYKIKTVEGTDDYGMMREVLTRRLKSGLAKADLPQLIVVDGGKGQLNVARSVLEELKIDGLDVVSLAKARVIDGVNDADGGVLKTSERVFIPGIREPIILRSNTHEYFLMTQLRDEAHRFAINFHRKRRIGRNFKSALDEIPGVGPGRRKILLRHFGSLKGIKAASSRTISELKGFSPALAETILRHLKPDDDA
ncbi:MAG: excinuclease ABC subunit UvrC [Myxococcota bacterium]|nr:excinuclease ABC subunit UvrC [Myxococcota bacterium]